MEPVELARRLLAEWKLRADQLDADRDPVVRDAYKCGVSVHAIHQLTGLSRTTIYKILGMEEGGQQ